MTLTLSDIDDALDTDPAFAMSLYATRRTPQIPPSLLISEDFELTPTHAQAALNHLRSGAHLGVSTPDLKSIRATHHRAAQLLAAGMDRVKVARLCNYTPEYVSALQSDPAFAELLAYYASKVEEEFDDFVAAASALSMDFLGELQRRLDTNPEGFKNLEVLQAVKDLADRSGHGPSSTSKVDVRSLTATMSSEDLNSKLAELINQRKDIPK